MGFVNGNCEPSGIGSFVLCTGGHLGIITSIDPPSRCRQVVYISGRNVGSWDYIEDACIEKVIGKISNQNEV